MIKLGGEGMSLDGALTFFYSNSSYVASIFLLSFLKICLKHPFHCFSCSVPLVSSQNRQDTGDFKALLTAYL